MNPNGLHEVLATRARALRKAEPEKNKEVYAELERADFSLQSIVVRTMGRPFLMLAVEPSESDSSLRATTVPASDRVPFAVLIAVTAYLSGTSVFYSGKLALIPSCLSCLRAPVRLVLRLPNCLG